MKGSSLNFCSVFFFFTVYMILMLFYFHWSFHLWILIFCWCFPTTNWKYFLLENSDKRTLLTWYILYTHICLDQSCLKKKKSLHTRLFWIYFSLNFFFFFFLLKSYMYWLQRRKNFQFLLLNVCMVLPNHTMIVTFHRVLYFIRASDIASKEHVNGYSKS